MKVGENCALNWARQMLIDVEPFGVNGGLAKSVRQVFTFLGVHLYVFRPLGLSLSVPFTSSHATLTRSCALC